MSRVVILDHLWPLEVRPATFAGLDVTVERAERAVGDDVVAVVVAPEQEVRAEVLHDAPHVRVVGTCSTGFDNIAVDELTAAGVRCLHVAGYCDEEVAEHALTLAMALLRAVPQLDRHTRAGGWWPYPCEPRRVGGSVLGVVGFGRIGRLVAARGQAVGMEVIATDAVVDATTMAGAGVRAVGLDELLAASDVVTLHVPLLPETRHLIDADRLRRMRPDAYLVNCARAGLIDHAALGQALSAGIIAGAAIDVFPVEPPPADDPAFGWPNTIVQPHAAWYSPEAKLAPYDLLLEDVARVLRGEEPISPIHATEVPR